MQRKLFFSLLVLVVCLPLAGAAPASRDPEIKNCLLTLIEELPLPAREPGPLAAMEATEGMQVKKGMTLGHIDDSDAVAQKKVKSFESAAATEKASSDIDITFAKAATKVAIAELEVSKEANRRAANAVTVVDINRLDLTVTKSELSIDKAIKDQNVDKLTAKVKEAEVEAADLAIQRRQLVAPFDGVVVKVYRHTGEWVSPGDAVMRIVYLEHLYVEGFLNASDYAPEEIEGCKVSVDVELAHGRHVKVPGKIVFASPLVQAGGEYQVKAEVKNRTVDGQEGSAWILRPGLNATMTIHLGSGGPVAVNPAK